MFSPPIRPLTHIAALKLVVYADAWCWILPPKALLLETIRKWVLTLSPILDRIISITRIRGDIQHPFPNDLLIQVQSNREEPVAPIRPSQSLGLWARSVLQTLWAENEVKN